MTGIPNSYRVVHRNRDWPRNWPIIKNPQFLPNGYETWSKLNLPECQFDWIKIVDFLLVAYSVGQSYQCNLWMSHCDVEIQSLFSVSG